MTQPPSSKPRHRGRPDPRHPGLRRTPLPPALSAESLNEREKVLVLQGGGALGAYQAGAYEALVEADIEPDWIAGISIGSINTALIAGNPPERRVEALTRFWEQATRTTALIPAVPTGMARGAWNTGSALESVLFGVPGFFTPRWPAPWALPYSDPAKVSFYDTAPLRDTLEELVDFDLLNDGPVRVSLGAVNVETGNMIYFDSAETRIGPEHVMASGALPPAFPPVEIEGALYWDGGLVSNAPLQYVLEEGVQIGRAPGNSPPMLIYQLDLFSASGPAPRMLSSIETREKDIRFSSRTRAATQRMQLMTRVSGIAQRLAEKLPAEMRDDPDLKLLIEAAASTDVTLIHLIYRQAAYEGGAKDYEFSRASMREHWQAGYRDARRSNANADWEELLARGEGMKTFDLGAL